MVETIFFAHQHAWRGILPLQSYRFASLNNERRNLLELLITNIHSTSVPAKILVYRTFAVIPVVGIRELVPKLATILFSIFSALIFTPLVHWIRRKRIPGKISVLLVILLFVLIVSILGGVIAGAGVQFGDQITVDRDQLVELWISSYQ